MGTKIKRMTALLLSAATMGASLSALPAYADEEEAEGVEMFLTYSDYADSSIDYWDNSDDINPTIEVTTDGEYTLEFTFPDGVVPENCGGMGIMLEGGENYEDLQVKSVDVAIDGTELTAGYIAIEKFNENCFYLINNTDGEDYTVFAGASELTVTFEVTGLGNGEEEEEEETDSDAPTLGFDGNDWTDYIGVFDDMEKDSFSLSGEKDAVYQGASIKLVANVTSIPDYSNGSEKAMGIKLDASAFGLESFDGYTLNFYARFNSGIEGKLEGDCVYVMGQTADGELSTSSIKQIVYSATSNVNNYEKQFFTVPSDTNTTSVIIKVPVNEAYSGTVLYLDNLTIMDGSANAIATLDTYNAKAEVSDQGDTIKQNKKENTVETKEIEKESTKMSAGTIVIIVVAIVAVVAIGVFLFIKLRKRFY